MDTNLRELPLIIQGGMGAGVSGWRLARTVSQAGQLGVVSGTALSIILARRLQRGDSGGHVRRALEHFPFAGMAERIVERYFIPGGKSDDVPFKAVPVPALPLGRDLEELTVVSNFVEIFLAKEGHRGLVGINYLEKIQTPTLPSLYGAMLAGVDFVLMGAGIPRTIPGIMDALSKGQPVKLKIDVKDAKRDEEFFAHFDPAAYAGEAGQTLNRPKFLAIIAAATLAAVLAKKSTGKVDGFVVEGPTAGGHNAPPRGPLRLNSLGEPIYTERDDVDLGAMVDLGLPFWLAGSYAEPERLSEALRAGACGVQVGTAFAYCDESDLDPEFKRAVLAGLLSRRHSGLHRPVGLAHGVSVQGRATRTDPGRRSGVRRAAANLRCRLSAACLYAAERSGGMAVPGRTGGRLRPQRGLRRRDPAAASASATRFSRTSASSNAAGMGATRNRCSPPAWTRRISHDSSTRRRSPTPHAKSSITCSTA